MIKKIFTLFFSLGLMTFASLMVSCGSDDDESDPNGGGTPNPESALVNQWIAAANHDYNTLIGVMEGYLQETYGTRGEIFNNYNKAAVQDGRNGDLAEEPTFTSRESLFLVSVHTYHYNLSRLPGGSSVIEKGITSWLEDENGKAYGVPAFNYWCYGQGSVVGSCWNSFPMTYLPAGTYTVKCSNPASWSYNSRSNNKGFAVVHAVAGDI